MLSNDDDEFESCQLCGHEQGLLDELVARRVKAHREGRDAVQDNLRKIRAHVENNTVQLLASLMDAQRRWTAREVAVEVGVCHKTVLHILGYRKLEARWMPHEISEVQQ